MPLHSCSPVHIMTLRGRESILEYWKGQIQQGFFREVLTTALYTFFQDTTTAFLVVYNQEFNGKILINLYWTNLGRSLKVEETGGISFFGQRPYCKMVFLNVPRRSGVPDFHLVPEPAQVGIVAVTQSHTLFIVPLQLGSRKGHPTAAGTHRLRMVL